MDNLLTRLSDLAEWADANEYEVPINLGDTLREAAEEIRRLAEERDAKWISVKDRKPEWLDDVLCRVLIVGDGGLSSIAYKILHITALNGCSWNCTGMIVTHWMPLPEPPKEDVCTKN